MSTSAGTITYNVNADVQSFLSSMKEVKTDLAQTGDSMKQADQSAAKLETGLSKLSAAFAALGAARAISSAVQMIEKYNEMADRIRLATSSTQEFEMVQASLATTANNTYRSLSEAQEVYITTADALRSLGYTTSQALDITDSMSYSMVKNATSAERGKAAISAFSGAIQTGKVEVDAWKTIVQAMPTVIEDVATAAGKTSEEIRKIGASGKLSADMLNQGFLQSLKANKEAADGMATSTKDAFRQVENSLAATLSALNEQSGALDAVVSGVKMASQVIQDFGTNAEAMSAFLAVAGTAAAATAAVIAGRLVGALGAYAVKQAEVVAATVASVNASQAAAGASLMLARAELSAAEAALAKVQALRASALSLNAAAVSSEALAAATARVTAAQTAMQAALVQTAGAATAASTALTALRGVMTFLGGPLGLIMIAATALYYFANAAKQTKVDVDSLNGSLKSLTFNQLAKASNDAGDDIEKLNKRLANVMHVMRSTSQMPWESNGDFEKRKVEWRAEYDEIKSQIKARQDLQAAIKSQQDEITKKQVDEGKPREANVHVTSDADATVLNNLKEQRALALLAGEARARLAAEQKLSASASGEEKRAAGDLAVEIYRLTEAKKEGIKTTKEGAAEQKKADEEAKRGAEQNATAIADYGVSIGLAAMKGEDLAKAQAVAKLNKFATPEDVKVMEALGRAMYQNQQIEANKQKLASVDPMANEALRYENELKALDELNAAKALSDQRYYELKTAAALTHDETVRQLEEAAFIRQSEATAFLMRSIDALGSATTSTITGLLSGTMTAQDAMRNFASIILNEAVGSLVQMGIQAIKQALIQRTAAATAAAAYAGGVAAQVATTTALAGQAAFASTAAIPVVGPAAAPAAATAAISAAGALGAPAVASAAGVAGGRLYGGDVNAGSMYAVAEDGSPEIFKSDNGKQYMIPGSGGEVVSNKDASLGSGSIVIHQQFNFDSEGSSSTSSGGGRDKELADQFESMTVTIISRETQPGGVIWDMSNGRG